MEQSFPDKGQFTYRITQASLMPVPIMYITREEKSPTATAENGRTSEYDQNPSDFPNIQSMWLSLMSDTY